MIEEKMKFIRKKKEKRDKCSSHVSALLPCQGRRWLWAKWLQAGCKQVAV